MGKDSFCSNSLPLTSARWVRSTIKLCTVHSLSLSRTAVDKSLQHRISLSKRIPQKNKRNSFVGKTFGNGNAKIEPGAAGWEAQTLPLCYAASSPPCGKERLFIYHVLGLTLFLCHPQDVSCTLQKGKFKTKARRRKKSPASGGNRTHIFSITRSALYQLLKRRTLKFLVKKRLEEGYIAQR